jgi:NitT/TauT family transport system substrate-binding protein
MMLMAGRAGAQELTIGTIGASSDAPFFIAERKGYFRDEGITAKFIRFDAASKMIPSLGTGEIDVGSGATSAALFNAAKRGVGIKIVADKAHNAPGYPFQSILVRKELIDNGKVKSLKDLKGAKIAFAPASDAFLDLALKRVGLKFSDIDPLMIGLPQHIAALQNGAADASVTAEPNTSQILKLGAAVRLIGADEVFPNYQTAVIFYGSEFIKNKKDVAAKAMKAILRGARYYNDALTDGKIAGPNADELIAILVEYSHIKDPSVHRSIVSHAMNPDGSPNLESLGLAWEFFRESKQIDGSVRVEDVLDLSFAKAAAAALGPYQNKAGRQ